MTAVATFTVADYDHAFAAEREREYPLIDAFEERSGFAIDRSLLEEAARVLACPIKRNGANWQHGRVLYAAARQYMETYQGDGVSVLDIGTAKGFSALCLRMACGYGSVVSVDVIDPKASVYRNTVAEVMGDGPLTLAQTIGRAGFWKHAVDIEFVQSTGIEWLTANKDRIHIAFIDGKHEGHIVRREGVLLTKRQQTGDLAIFDDVHLPDVSQAVVSLHHDYTLEYIEVLPHRHYAVGVRK